MDNVTHTLAGMLLAESALQLRARRSPPEPSPGLRRTAVIASAVAANLPDGDLLYTGFGGDKLGYLLHHRGHTHTVLMVLLAAGVLWGIVLLALRWRRGSPPSRSDSWWLLALITVSTASHLILDWTNSYGVHPFWPFDNRWFYGDAVFIVEPWLWVVSVPVLVAASTQRVTRILLSLVLLLALGLAWRVDLVASGAAAALTAGAALSVVLARSLGAGHRAALAVAAWAAVTVVMTAASSRAHAAVMGALRNAAPDSRVLDVVVTQLPANPICASIISLEIEGETYRVTAGRVSNAPSITPASSCPDRGRAGPLFRASPRAATPRVHWDSEWTAPVGELLGLARDSCPAAAALRFIRAPVWRSVDDSTVVLGDVRYGGGSGNGFSDVTLPRRETACPPAVPPWEPPRTDLLGM
jgi:inner membrane protein